MPSYRLIWFQHFEKAAGTTLVQLARINNETLYPNNSNGCPRTEGGTFIEVWDYDQKQLKEFIDYCESSRITFVSTAFGAPDFQSLAEDKRIRLITTLRDPTKRFVSHFHYDYFRGGPYRNIRDFQASGRATRYSFPKLNNYYCRILSRNELCAKISAEAFKEAGKNLSLFDFFAIVGTPNWINYTCEYLNWTPFNLHTNRSGASLSRMISLCKYRQFDLLYRHLFFPPDEPSENFIKVFEKNNREDRALYNLAVHDYKQRNNISGSH